MNFSVWVALLALATAGSTIAPAPRSATALAAAIDVRIFKGTPPMTRPAPHWPGHDHQRDI
jgi:hypothetical protein